MTGGHPKCSDLFSYFSGEFDEEPHDFELYQNQNMFDSDSEISTSFGKSIEKELDSTNTETNNFPKNELVDPSSRKLEDITSEPEFLSDLDLLANENVKCGHIPSNERLTYKCKGLPGEKIGHECSFSCQKVDNCSLSVKLPRKKLAILPEKSNARQGKSKLPLKKGISDPTSYSPQTQGSSQQQKIPLPTKCSKPFENSYKRLIPWKNKVGPDNYCELLVRTLRDCSKYFSLDDFYKLLYNSGLPDRKTFTAIKPNNSEPDLKFEGLRLCLFTLETIGLSHLRARSFLLHPSQNLLDTGSNNEDVFRNYLAIKILLDFIKEVDDKSRHQVAISRKSLYKAYSVICAKLEDDIKLVSLGSFRKMKTVVGVSQLGKLIKLVYPDLSIRRLGRRGESKHHYLGIMWNESIVDDEMIRIHQLDKTMIVKRFTNVSGQRNKGLESVDEKREKIRKEENSKEINFPALTSLQNTGQSMYSYVGIDSKIPIIDCSPRVWKYFPGKVPEQSIWFKKLMSKSMLALKKYNLEMESVITNFHQDIFSTGEKNIFFDNFCQKLNILIESNAEKEAYMHFYLTIFLLVFPVIIATDAEVPRESKIQLRKNLKTFINPLSFDITTLPGFEENHFLNFLHIIRKMIHINEMTSCHIKTSLTEKVIHQIVHDFKSPHIISPGVSETSPFEQLICNAIIMIFKAYQPFVYGNQSELTSKFDTDSISSIAKVFLQVLSQSTDYLSKIPEKMHTDELNSEFFDLPFQMFKNSVRLFHEVFLSNHLILKLPVQVISCVFRYINKEMHVLSFQNFGRLNSEVSTETFKVWWIHSTLAEEYMQILAEIISLSDRLPSGTVKKS